MEPVISDVPSRRERIRTATLAEIRSVARQQLTDGGSQAISLRGIARHMGMSTAALYRYYPNLEALIVALCVELYDELCDAMRGEGEQYAEDDVLSRLMASVRGFRSWSINHRPEFALIFASGTPGTVVKGSGLGCGSRADMEPTQEPRAAALRFSRVFGELFYRYYLKSQEADGPPLLIPQIPELPAELAEEILTCNREIGADLPLELAYVFLDYWIRIYGLIAMEVFGHLPIVENVESLYEAELVGMGAQIGVSLDDLPATTMPTNA